MRLVLIALVALTASAGPSLGQQKSPPGSITTPDKASDDEAVESCVEVEIDGAKALDCINRRLKGDVDRVNPVPNIPPIDARSQDIHLGIVNVPACSSSTVRISGNLLYPIARRRPFSSRPSEVADNGMRFGLQACRPAA